jgi:hypothetical protein
MKILQKKTFLEAIKNSVGSKQYRNFFVEINGEEKDILEDGKNSCAYFVSSLLKEFNLLEEVHTTVDGLVKDLGEKWEELSVIDREPGDILIWESEGQMGHIGFAIEDGEAISNSTEKRVPHIHSQGFGGTRMVSKVFKHIENL